MNRMLKLFAALSSMLKRSTYFDDLTKLFSNLCSAKFLGTSAKPFFLGMYHLHAHLCESRFMVLKNIMTFYIIVKYI